MSELPSVNEETGKPGNAIRQVYSRLFSRRDGRKSLASRIFRTIRDNLFSSLTRRIVTLNLTALAVLLATILYMNQFREGLIDARIDSLLTQGRIIASAIASSVSGSQNVITIDPEKLIRLKEGESLQPAQDALDTLNYPINPEQVAPVLRALIKPTQTRARIYDPEGILILDSRLLYSGGDILSYSLPPVGTAGNENSEVGWIQFISNNLNRILSWKQIPTYRELPGPGTQYEEVQSALNGSPTSIVRMTEAGELTVSVALPIQSFRAIRGILLLSTEGDDIDRIVGEERIEILRIFLVAAIVMLVLSVLLASTIANPLQRLSDAAKRVKRGVKSRVEIPDFSNRQDEIGNLSTSIGDMTNALYQRIEAIERFAADVSHELKNPLTSLRSAVETLPLAKTEESRNRLMDVIQHDVKRLDRLITDIADASRLDADLVRETAEPVNLVQLVEGVVATNQDVAARTKNVTITLSVEQADREKRPLIISGHDMRLGQVIHNLLDNAVSFVPENTGLVAIGLAVKNDNAVLTITDNGPGIEEGSEERIFERFYTDRSEYDGFGQNSGLGLSISRQIVEAHGGTITAENRSDGISGAVFVATLPLETAKK